MGATASDTALGIETRKESAMGASPEAAIVARVVVRRGEYHDPTTLVNASEAARSVAGVSHVAVGMADPLNLGILVQRHGYDLGGDGLGPNELLLTVGASNEAEADETLAVLEG